MVTKQVPLFGDKEILPKGRVERPSTERMPFGPSGVRLDVTVPHADVSFLDAPDLKGVNWRRKRGDEWTTPEFRQIVFQFLIDLMANRSWIKGYFVEEHASAERSIGRLPDKDIYLVVRVTRREDNRDFEAAINFPPDRRENNPTLARSQLDKIAVAIDASEAAA